MPVLKCVSPLYIALSMISCKGHPYQVMVGNAKTIWMNKVIPLDILFNLILCSERRELIQVKRYGRLADSLTKLKRRIVYAIWVRKLAFSLATYPWLSHVLFAFSSSMMNIRMQWRMLLF